MVSPRAGVIGTLNYDITIHVDRIPPPGGEARVTRIDRRLGGKGGNTVTALARLLGGAEFFGVLGRDDAMQAHMDFFERIKVNASGVQVRDDVGSGVSFVMVDPSGQNTISSYPGANLFVNEGYVDSIRDALSGLGLLIATNVSPSVASRAFSAVKGIRIYVPAVYSRADPEGVRRVNADYVMVNEDEHRWLGDVHGKVVRTMGSRGAAILVNGEEALSAKAIDLASLGMQVRSTVGAGDTFTGAFGAFVLMEMSEREALFLANAAAALKVINDDPRGSPGIWELVAFLESASADRGLLDRLRKVAEEALSEGGH